MTTDKLNNIYEGLKDKSSTKQKVYRVTVEVFQMFKQLIKETADELNTRVRAYDPNIEVVFYDLGAFEFHLKFSGDTLVFMMHTNVFTFPQEHFIHKTSYIKEDPHRRYCGLIQIYNFLSDSIKYNREEDLGYLIGRFYVNKDNHFFIEGKRQLSFLYSNMAEQVINRDTVLDIIEQAMLYCLEFELLTPPYENVQIITVEQKNHASHSSGHPTGKRLGFMYSNEKD